MRTSQERRNGLYQTVIIVLVFLLILSRTACVGPKPTKINRVQKRLITSDTVFIKGKSDTVEFIVEKPIKVPVYIEDLVVVYDTIYLKDSSKKYISKYMQPFEDSLIHGKIFANIDMDSCTLDSLGFEYTPKFPKYITRVDTIKITNEILAQRAFLIGATVGGNSMSFSTRLKGGFRTYTGIDYLYEYDLINKTHNIGVTIPIRWPR